MVNNNPRGGSSCAVATCTNYSGKIKTSGRIDLSFHRFPKDDTVAKNWQHLYDFVRDLKAELLEYEPKIRYLKQNVLPSLNLPLDHAHTPLSESSLNRRNRMNVKHTKQAHDQLILSSIEQNESNIEVGSNSCTADNILDYEQLYNNLIQEHEALKTQFSEENRLNQYEVDYKRINENLRFDMKILQKNLSTTNKLLQENQKHMKAIKIRSLDQSKAVENQAKKLVSSVLTRNQLDLILKKKKRVRWSREEVSKAFTLRYFSKKAYKYVKDELHYPLPGLSCLPRWTKTIDMRNGVLQDVLKIMKLNGETLNDYEKLTVLMFDKVKVSYTMEYDMLHDQVLGPLNQMQVIVCCVSDCGGGNVGLWKELEVNHENSIFDTPNGQSIICVPDAPHLLKLIRNWFLDTGFNLNGNVINKKPIETLITLTRYQLIEDTKLNNNTANFIELINNWFDLANVAHPYNYSSPFKSPYGKFLKEQNCLFNEVYETINQMRCVGESCLQIFQKGILMHINGTRHLLNVLKENGLSYLLTSKINQDALENLFSQIRSKGGLNDHPSPLNAIYRLKMIILGKNLGITSTHSNTIDDNKEEFMVANAVKSVNLKLGDEHIGEDEIISSDTDTASENGSQLSNEDKNKVEYLAGWVAKRHRFNIPGIGSTTTQVNKNNINNTVGHDYEIPSWINHVSYGGLIEPSSEFKKIIFRIERLFNKFTKNTINKGPNIVKQLTNKILCRMEIEDKWKPSIQTYIKQRILIRMKYYNQNALLLKKKNKAKNSIKKLSKLKKL
ncbi:hypothetical protein AGLY_007739 [Aphis glycines]|uniref:Transposable element P transposase n=1 Tax=Aphis glycines TaxID=307491 RepID=A0A6G0TN20_APHGL|nr:hypothetical protein AGLY_007739 [Aphis glycines]